MRVAIYTRVASGSQTADNHARARSRRPLACVSMDKTLLAMKMLQAGSRRVALVNFAANGGCAGLWAGTAG